MSLEIIDRTTRALSTITDPGKLVHAYKGIYELLPNRDHMAVSRRGVEPPYFLVT